jgi:hypothetical protein
MGGRSRCGDVRGGARWSRVIDPITVALARPLGSDLLPCLALPGASTADTVRFCGGMASFRPVGDSDGGVQTP